MPEKTDFLAKFCVATDKSPHLIIEGLRLQASPPWPYWRVGALFHSRPDLFEVFNAVVRQRYPEKTKSWTDNFYTADDFFDLYPDVKGEFYVFDLENCAGWVMVSHSEAEQVRAALTYREPLNWGRSFRKNPHSSTMQRACLFGNRLWALSKQEELLSVDELRLVLLEKIDSERLKFERLRRKFDNHGGTPTSRREQILESVRIFVWRRDEGKCVRCGSAERLEFDHIIPVIKGGSSTERNVQLLCERCNRVKGAELG